MGGTVCADVGAASVLLASPAGDVEVLKVEESQVEICLGDEDQEVEKLVADQHQRNYHNHLLRDTIPELSSYHRLLLFAILLLHDALCLVSPRLVLLLQHRDDPHRSRPRTSSATSSGDGEHGGATAQESDEVDLRRHERVGEEGDGSEEVKPPEEGERISVLAPGQQRELEEKHEEADGHDGVDDEVRLDGRRTAKFPQVCAEESAERGKHHHRHEVFVLGKLQRQLAGRQAFLWRLSKIER
mmetsp:Transcript_25819/g.58131  ORF Transcript_25819/g.58131 Transcript_25819/m.58131 type:complete len:243 (-) Transcript_25819:219-947(-)